MIRGFLARRYYKRLRAAYLILTNYKRFKACSYINNLQNTFK